MTRRRTPLSATALHAHRIIERGRFSLDDDGTVRWHAPVNDGELAKLRSNQAFNDELHRQLGWLLHEMRVTLAETMAREHPRRLV